MEEVKVKLLELHAQKVKKQKAKRFAAAGRTVAARKNAQDKNKPQGLGTGGKLQDKLV